MSNRNKAGILALVFVGLGLMTIGPSAFKSIFHSNGPMDWIVSLVVLVWQGFSILAVRSMIIGDNERLFCYMSSAVWTVLLVIAIVTAFYNPTQGITLTSLQFGSVACGFFAAPAFIMEDLRDGWK